MKNLSFFIMISIISFFINTAIAQHEIQYGSNNGQYISIKNTQIYYEEYGDGTPLFLLHGATSSIRYFRNVIPELSNHFRIIALDFPDHGRSYHTDTLSYQLLSDFLSEMIDLLDFDSVYVFGCSMGSIAGLILAHDRPDKVKRIVSDGGVMDFAGLRENYIEFYDTRKSFSKDYLDWYNSINPEKEKLEDLISNRKRVILELIALAGSKVDNIKSRTLIMMGDRDQVIKLEHGLYLYETIPNSEFFVIPNGGHCNCNLYPDLVNNIVINFLTKE